MKNYKKLKVALLVGTLGQGGAEKQLVYMARALLQAGVDVRVFSLTRGEYYEPDLQSLGLQPQWIGHYSNPATRLLTFMTSLRDFRPHIIQSAHFYANLYVSLISPIYNAVSVGSIRNDVVVEMESNPIWGKPLLKWCGSLIANSHLAVHNAVLQGISPENIYHLPNIIDLEEFDKKNDEKEKVFIKHEFALNIVTVSVGRLVPEKRFDRYIDAFAIAHREEPALLGIIVGDGPEKANLQEMARQKGLSEEKFIFLGRRDDVPSILRKADIFMLTSDHEGFPNVLLEAMAAMLPVITTPAGDSGKIVQDGLTGNVVHYDDTNELANCLIRLARSKKLRQKMGQAGRERVEQVYGADELTDNILSIYKQIAIQKHSHRLIKALPI